MRANAKLTKQTSLPTLEDVDAGKVTLDEYEIAHGEDIPEWTAADLARARLYLIVSGTRCHVRTRPRSAGTAEGSHQGAHRAASRQRRSGAFSAGLGLAGRAASTRCVGTPCQGDVEVICLVEE